MKHLLFLPAFALMTAVLPAAIAADDPMVVRFGTLAPDGTPWARLLQSFKKKVETDSKGRIQVKLYLNGVQGDEKDMLRKIRAGQLNAGGFSTSGLAAVVPELQVLELPFLFRNAEEADYIMDQVILEDIRKLMEAKGLYLYCWAENGWLDIGAKTEINTFDDLKKITFAAQDSAVQRGIFESMGLTPKVLPVPDFFSALSTGNVNGYTTTPIFAFAAQWYTQTKHWTITRHSFQPAGVVFSLKAWQDLAPDLKNLVAGYQGDLQSSARKDVRGLDAALFKNFIKTGVKVKKADPELLKRMYKETQGAAEKLIKDGVIPRALYDKIQNALKEHRAKK
ncbi:MAG: hypothetical protein GMKNLPBB_00382 [Myxococcota bacterium]|nr:hypothetical protein [Myxococcota bacterium]